jgi:hypothetical protein
MVFWAGILAGAFFAWLGVKIGFYETWTMLFTALSKKMTFNLVL